MGKRNFYYFPFCKGTTLSSAYQVRYLDRNYYILENTTRNTPLCHEWMMHADFKTCIMFLLCSIVDNSKLARNQHGMFHDVQTSVEKKKKKNWIFQPFIFSRNNIAKTPFNRGGSFGEAGGGQLVCLFILVFVLALMALTSDHCIHGRVKILFVQKLC